MTPKPLCVISGKSARHSDWKGQGAYDQERISELLADLVQALPDGQAPARSEQAGQ